MASTIKTNAELPSYYRGVRGAIRRFLLGGDASPRNVYTACGYPQEVTYEEFYGKYIRNGFARRIVDSYPDACWQNYPVIREKNKQSTEPSTFEKQIDTLNTKYNLFSQLKKADTLSRIGAYGGLIIGTNGDMQKPIQKGETLTFLKGYSQGTLRIGPLNYNPTSPRYGLPLEYIITPQSTTGTPTGKLNIHWSRVIHLSEFITDDRIYGHSALECIWNRLLDCDKIMGASGEMFWRASYPKQIFSADPEARLDPSEVPALEQKLEDMMYGLKDSLIMQGLQSQTVQGSVTSPADFIESQLLEISSATGIPKRIFIGTEEGQLAGEQDTENWLSKVETRRRNYCIPYIIRPLLDRLISVGILDDAPYEIQWDSAAERSPTMVADLNDKYLSMLSNYVSSGLSAVIPKKEFLTDFMKIPVDKAQAYLDAAGEDAGKDDLLGQEGEELMDSLRDEQVKED